MRGLNVYLLTHGSWPVSKNFLNCYKLVSGNMEEDMYDKVGRRRMDRLFIDTGISCQEAVDIFTWTNATLIRLLQLQKKS